MISPAIPSIFDAQAYAALQRGVRAGDPRATKAATQQFEALLLQTLLKAMRATAPADGLLASDETRFYQELFDAQLANALAARGGVGLAGLLEKQLRGAGDEPPPTESGEVRAAAAHTPAAAPLQRDDGRGAFVARVRPAAESAAARLGVPATFLIAQAALESGWGQAEPRLADGRSSFNLFGVKAGSSWEGPVAESWSQEFLGGRWVKRLERFRAYASYEEAFADYAELIARRHPTALSDDPLAFALGLQRSGYATDPHYAEKLLRVIRQLA